MTLLYMKINSIKISILILLFGLSYNLSYAQNIGKIDGLNARHFQLHAKHDSIDFILVDGKIDTVKPVILFCQGSSPIPLIIRYEDGEKFIPSLSCWDYEALSKRFHIVIISMPKTPIEVGIEKLGKEFTYVLDKKNPGDRDPAYVANNYFENYVSRAKKVISYLYKQNWVLKNRITIIGHSRGSKIALKASVGNAKIYKIGFFSGNPFGLIDQYIRGSRRDVELGEITIEQSQLQINDLLKTWAEINKKPNSDLIHLEDSDRMWTSFEKPLINDFLKAKQPIYVAYGTEDIKSALCDLLPIYFIQAHNKGLTLKPYLGLEHNFFETNKKRKAIYDKPHWNEVMGEFINWVEN